jgi:hypothetical protein
MTTTAEPTVETTTTAPEMVPFDLYKDVHKGIRGALFGVTTRAGNLDPADRAARRDLAGQLATTFRILGSHAEHEETYVQAVVERHAPRAAAAVLDQHRVIDGRMIELQANADAAVDAVRSEQRARLHDLYLDVATFTADYLEHQDFEERVVMPALADAMTVPELLVVHRDIVAGIPPDEMAEPLALMLPAMNVDDRTELLGGMQADAPAEVFAGVWSLASSVLAPADVAELGARLGL